MKLTRFSILFCLTLIPAAAMAADDPAGLEQLRVAAGNGNVESMVELGILYEFGFRMADNKAHALAWYRLAAERGSAKAAERQNALKPSLNTKELDDSNRIYTEIVVAPAAATTQTAPAAPAAVPQSVPAAAAPPAPAPANAPAATTEPLTPAYTN